MRASNFRLIFMGTPHFAAPILQAIIDAGFSVVAVYSQPPRPAGRGYEVLKSPVHQLAESHDIPVFTPASLKSQEEQETFAALKADVAVVAAYGLILPPPVLHAPNWGCINVHASLLPRWRGAAPIQRAILAGDTQTGVCIMRMEAGLDTGPVYRRATTPILPHTTTAILHDTLAQLGGQEIIPVLDAMQAGVLDQPEEQPEHGVTYAHKLTNEEGVLDWRRSALEIDRCVRALNPWPGTFTFFGKTRLKILAVTLMDEAAQHGDAGQVIGKGLIACGTGVIRLDRVQKPGGKAVSLAEFLNGTPLPEGAQLRAVESS